MNKKQLWFALLAISLIANTAFAQQNIMSLPFVQLKNTALARQILHPKIKWQYGRLQPNQKVFKARKRVNIIGGNIHLACQKAAILSLVDLQKRAIKIGASRITGVYSPQSTSIGRYACEISGSKVGVRLQANMQRYN